jgi:hypothetical protein
MNRQTINEECLDHFLQHFAANAHPSHTISLKTKSQMVTGKKDN